MPESTYISKNFDSGLLHAYRFTGSHYRRRCGSRGIDEFIGDVEGVTEVSVSWFVNQSDSCRKCKSTFDVEHLADTDKIENLHEIASKYSDQPKRSKKQPDTGNEATVNFASTSAEDGNRFDDPDIDEVNCPVLDCSYSGTVDSVAGHITGKRNEAHDWNSIGFDGANEFKELINKALEMKKDEEI